LGGTIFQYNVRLPSLLAFPFILLGIQPIIPYEIFVFGSDMLRELGYKIAYFEELYVLFPVVVMLRYVNNRPVRLCIKDFL